MKTYSLIIHYSTTSAALSVDAEGPEEVFRMVSLQPGQKAVLFLHHRGVDRKSPFDNGAYKIGAGDEIWEKIGDGPVLKVQKAPLAG